MARRKITSMFFNLVVILIIFWIFCLMHFEFYHLESGQNDNSSINSEGTQLKLIIKEEIVQNTDVVPGDQSKPVPLQRKRILRIWMENPLREKIRYYQFSEEEDSDPEPRPKLLNATILDAIDSTWDPEGLIRKLDTPSAQCRKLVSFGGKLSCGAKDGHKFVCFDFDVAPVAIVNQLGRQAMNSDKNRQTDSRNNGTGVLGRIPKVIDVDEEPSDFITFFKSRKPKKNPCLVFSFGIATDMTFDRAIAKFGCKTYSYDMTIVNTTSRKVQPNLNYLNIGLDVEAHDLDMTMMPSKTRIRSSVRSLGEIREILNQEDMYLDVFKLDIEYAEWKVFDALVNSDEGKGILAKVNQIALEIHLDGMKNESESVRVVHGQQYESVIDSLSDLGFKMVYTFLNEFSQKFALVRGKVLPLYRESLFVRRS